MHFIEKPKKGQKNQNLQGSISSKMEWIEKCGTFHCHEKDQFYPCATTTKIYIIILHKTMLQQKPICQTLKINKI